jgi:hypothetical protein
MHKNILLKNDVKQKNKTLLASKTRQNAGAAKSAAPRILSCFAGFLCGYFINS